MISCLALIDRPAKISAAAIAILDSESMRLLLQLYDHALIALKRCEALIDRSDTRH
jgi:hypothetical protein